MRIEITSDHWATAKKAIINGADRLELCTALELGGLTPHSSFIKLVSQEYATPIMALIRCRPGPFEYSEKEKNQMFIEMDDCLQAGANGLVVGALTSKNEIDWAFAESVSEKFSEFELVFHRAFDFVNNPEEDLSGLADLGFNRILTSGQAPTAWEGKENLKKFIKIAGDSIAILPAAGINAENALALAQYIDCKELHLSAKKYHVSNTENRIMSLDYYDIDENQIKMLKETFDNK